MKKYRVLVAVSNDLVTDQRVHKVCELLHDEMGFDVLLIGRRFRDSLPLQRTYDCKRMRLLFNKNVWFYAEFNIRLFFILLFKRCKVLVANDLDTLLPNYLVSKIRKKHLVYDSHEYFLGVPELETNSFAREAWKFIEKSIFPHLKHVFTVNDSIAQLYLNDYGKPLYVVRNIPKKYSLFQTENLNKLLNLSDEKRLVIMQGAGINIHRGAEEAVEAMQYVDNAVLLILGGGDVMETLKKMVNNLQLDKKVIFMNKKPYAEMMKYTQNAYLGLTLDKDTNINYKYSLPNKLFDYIQAQIPVLSSPLVELKRIIEKYDIGLFIESHNPKHIAEKINMALTDEARYRQWKSNLVIAANELNWENEKKIVIDVYKNFI